MKKIKKEYKIDNPKHISKPDKQLRNEIIKQLKKEYPARQLQRITGVSRGVISKI